MIIEYFGLPTDLKLTGMMLARVLPYVIGLGLANRLPVTGLLMDLGCRTVVRE